MDYVICLLLGALVGYAVCVLTAFDDDEEDFDTYLAEAESEDDFFV